PRLSERVPEISAGMDELVAQMLEKRPDARPPDMNAVAARLDALTQARFATAQHTSPEARLAAEAAGMTLEQTGSMAALPAMVGTNPGSVATPLAKTTLSSAASQISIPVQDDEELPARSGRAGLWIGL